MILFPDKIELETYRRVYPEIAASLGKEGRLPMAGELDFLERVAGIELPPGNVGPANLCFLSAAASVCRPLRTIEIGAASGTSTALLAAVADGAATECGLQPSGVLVHAIDKKRVCLFDSSKAIGYMVDRLAPELASFVRIHTERDSFLAQTLSERSSLDFAFIDGNHQHPWPLIDLLNLLPLMKPGSWIAMHDIDLPAVAARMNFEGRKGAKLLFDGWPLGKLASGNIGVIEAPADMNTVQPFLNELATFPFEVAPEGWKRYRTMLAAALDWAGSGG